MAKLDELESELYRKESIEDIEKRRQKKIFFSRPSSQLSHTWEEGGMKKPLPQKSVIEGRAVKFVITAFLSLLVAGGALFLFLYFGNRPEDVSLRIETRDEVEAGETLTISIPYKNVSRLPLRDGELTIILPPGTRVKEGGSEYEAPARITKTISDVAPGEERLEELAVRMFGGEKEVKEITATLAYRPENVSARFTKDASKAVTIIRVPLGITWEIPETLSQGQDVDFLVRYSSNSRDLFRAMSLRLDYPPGFTFVDADPKPSEGNGIWNIGDLKAGGSGVIQVRGTVSGEEGEIKTFRSGIGVYQYESKVWTPYFDSFHEVKIAVTPLFIQGRLESFREKIINPGDRLMFVLHYQNNTLFPLKDVIVRAYIDGSILDFQTMEIHQGGVFDFPTRSIVWGPANVEGFRDLPPGGGGDLTFSVYAKQTPSMKTAKDRNLTVRLMSHIEASGIPEELIGTELTHDDTVEFKVNSKVLFTGRALYTYRSFPNSGPIPPKVGKKTTYTIVWDVRNFTNDLRNAEVHASLPPNVKFERAFIPADAALSYTESSGEVRWNIGVIDAGQGVLSPARTVSFRVSITPSEADVGKIITLANPAAFGAEDTFTGERIEKMLSSFTTQIYEDPAVRGAGQVVP